MREVTMAFVRIPYAPVGARRWGVSSAQSAEWMEKQLPSIAALVSRTAYNIAFQGVI
jgi:hypothetical protein